MTSSHETPPATLDTPLELTPADWPSREVYFLMTGLVIPRPIAWVSTLDATGRRNLAPHSYFNVVAHDPPHVVFSSSGVKDTLRNVRATGEFVANLVSMEVVEAMNFTSTDFPPEEDEFTWAGVTPVPSRSVAPPRVAEARAALECRVVETVAAGNGTIVVGEVTHISVDPAVWRDGRVDPQLLDPVCRLAGTRYARLGEVFQLPRPSWSRDVEGTQPGAAIPRLGD
ncbi:MAG: flavin reductase family protein [Actinobacteria bacterium]|nr:flavin reductase family protein [Actinomycetota bacterium]